MLGNSIENLLNYGQDCTALVDETISFTYTQLADEIKHVSAVLISNNISSVAIYCKNSVDWCIVYLACFFSDIKVFPVSKDMSEEDLLKLCKNVPINSILCDLINFTELELNNISLPTYFSTKLIKLNESKYDEELVDVSTVLFTSGTTGKQKGVMLTQENLISNALSIIEYMGYSSTDKILVIKPLYHSSTLSGEFLASIFSGATLQIINSTFNPFKVLEVLNSGDCTVMCAVPTMFSMLVRYAKRYHANLRAVVVSGAFLDKRLISEIQDMFKCQLFHVYGLTEASPRVSYLAPEYWKAKIGSIGKPIPNVEVELVAEDGQIISEHNTVGELVVKGKNVMKGYFKEPVLSEEVLKNGYLFTGDLGYRDEDGFYFLCGRKDDMIVRGGINLWPEPIESAIKTLKAVKEVAVVGVEDYFYSQRIIAFIESDEVELSKEELMKACMEHKVVVPDIIEVVNKVPLGSTGKIQRKKLKKEWLEKNSR